MPPRIPARFRDLPPRWAHFCLGVERFMRDELGIDPIGADFLCAFSGGADSTALLLTLHCLSLKNGGTVTVAHLDHGLRPESGAEARHCQELCSYMGLSFVSKAVDVIRMAEAESMGLEEAGRKARYDFLNQQMKACGAGWIATGHHLGDLAEDVVMRLVRGTGWPGLSGMAGIDTKRRLIRPLLMTEKAILVEFLTELGFSWVEDASNADTGMTRNRIRHLILPSLLEENPNFLESAGRLWRLGRIDESYWDEQSDTVEGTLLRKEKLEASHKALRLRLYKAHLDRLGPGQALADTLLKMDDAWKNRRYGTIFQYPGDRTGKITPEGVVFGFKH